MAQPPDLEALRAAHPPLRYVVRDTVGRETDAGEGCATCGTHSGCPVPALLAVVDAQAARLAVVDAQAARLAAVERDRDYWQRLAEQMIREADR